MIITVDRIEEADLICELYGFPSCVIVSMSQNIPISEGDFLYYNQGAWQPLPKLTKARRQQIRKLMNVVFT